MMTTATLSAVRPIAMNVEKKRMPEMALEDREDLRLVEAYQRGDSAALGQLYRRHRARVESVARSVMGPSRDLEDAVQSVFVECHRALHAFRADSRFTTWLHRVTVNVCLQAMRKQRRWGFLRWIGLDEPALPEPSYRDEGRIESREIVGELYTILEAVGAKKRTVFVLFEVEGLTLEEIAEVVGTNINTVKSRLFHARREVFEEVKARKLLPQRELFLVKARGEE